VGLLVRTADGLEGTSEVLKRRNVAASTLPDPVPPVKYLPASFVHASMRAPGAIYQNIAEKERNEGDFALLYGTQFRQNSAFQEEFQQNDKAIDCEFIYPHGAATIDRGTVFDKAMCNNKASTNAICVADDKECLAHGPGACNGCKANPHDVGNLVGTWIADKNHELLETFRDHSCYYDNIQDAVTASNSLWSQRKRWYTYSENAATEYQGYTECATASLHMDDPGMADAIVLTLHRTPEPSAQSACHFPNHVWLDQRLKVAYEKGHGDLPVLFYRESHGIHRIHECVTVFGGRECDDAWQKEFFSQEYQFDGSCLHKPPGCDEVYYFPGAPGETCPAFTDAGKERIERLCREEKNHNARRAYEKLFRKSADSQQQQLVVDEKNQEEDVNSPPASSLLTGLDKQSGDSQVLSSSSATDTPIVPSAVDSRTMVDSAMLIQGTSTTDLIVNATFFMIGMMVTLFLRRKV
jgi:hypothetical protein